METTAWPANIPGARQSIVCQIVGRRVSECKSETCQQDQQGNREKSFIAMLLFAALVKAASGARLTAGSTPALVSPNSDPGRGDGVAF